MNENNLNRPSQLTPLKPKQDQAQNTKSSDTKESKNSILGSILLLLMAPVLAIVLTLYVFQSYQVDGPSMETTLQNNDRLIVWKLPRTIARITGNDFIPNRGDVIIFSEPNLGNVNSADGSKQLVKRVLALPGERVVVRDGNVTVYNSEHPEGFEPDITLPYGKEDRIPYTDGDTDTTLGDNQLFVCGDNRPHSMDSRMFGAINSDQIIGKLVMRIFPLDQIKLF